MLRQRRINCKDCGDRASASTASEGNAGDRAPASFNGTGASERNAGACEHHPIKTTTRIIRWIIILVELQIVIATKSTPR